MMIKRGTYKMSDYTIRGGVFETNSSSMHSIAVAKKHEKYTKEEILEDIYISESGKGYINIWNSDELDFGRYPFEVLCTFYDKMRYAIACANTNSAYIEYETGESTVDYGFTVKDVEDIVLKYVPEATRIEYPKERVEVYEDRTGKRYDRNKVRFGQVDDDYIYYVEDGNKKIEVRNNTSIYEEDNYYGSVDHQSWSLLIDFLRDNKITLEDFLTDKGYMVIIDGDEYCYVSKYINNGVINKNDFTSIVNSFGEDYINHKV